MYRNYQFKPKALISQVTAFLSNGPVIYIHSSISYMAEQIQALSASLSGVCINGLLSREDIDTRLELIKSNQVQILYITPEKLIQEKIQKYLPFPGAILLDEAHIYTSDSCNSKYNQSTANLTKYFEATFQNTPKLLMVGPTPYELCETLKRVFAVQDSMVFPNNYINYGNYDLTISKDDDKKKALINYLKKTRN